MPDVKTTPSQPTEWDARAALAEFEPLPRIGVLQSARRHWILVLLPILVFVPVAAAVALARTPTYTAEDRLMVGRLDMSSPGAIQGFAGAAQDLAQSYPLVIDADGVVDPVAKKFRTTPADIRAHLLATDVPSSSIVRLQATGGSAKDAVGLVNAASNSLVAFLTNFNRNNPDAVHLQKELQAAELALQADQAAAPRNLAHPASPAQQKASAALAAQRVVVAALGSNYESTVLTEADSSLLQPLTSAHSASSDRRNKLEIAVFAALVAGIVVGLGLATLRANRVAWKALTTPPWVPEDRVGVS